MSDADLPESFREVAASFIAGASALRMASISLGSVGLALAALQALSAEDKGDPHA
jgi:hypothetical protein